MVVPVQSSRGMVYDRTLWELGPRTQEGLEKCELESSLVSPRRRAFQPTQPPPPGARQLITNWKSGRRSKSESNISGPESWLWHQDCPRHRVSDKLLGLPRFSSGKTGVTNTNLVVSR